LKKFQEGIKLSQFCSNKLDETEKRVSILLKDEEGNIREEPFQNES
jgi:exodeoxyribonuclease VII small subunit